jgi:hypothetical protein
MEPHIEHTYPHGIGLVRWKPASFGPSLYEPYASEATKFGALIVRIIGKDGEELYRRSVLDA